MANVYVTVTVGNQTHRLGACRDGDTVQVWIVNGPVIGGFRIARFRGEKLTASTLRDMMEGKPA